MRLIDCWHYWVGWRLIADMIYWLAKKQRRSIWVYCLKICIFGKVAGVLCCRRWPVRGAVPTRSVRTAAVVATRRAWTRDCRSKLKWHRILARSAWRQRSWSWDGAPVVGLHLRELPVPRLGPASLPRHGRSGVDMHGRVRRRGRAGTAQSNHMDGTDRRVCVYAQNGRVKESLEFYAEMVPSGCRPDYGTFIRRSAFRV
jgi:pentatricopeptide repeat protein